MSNEYLQSILALSSPTQGSFLDKTLASISDYQTRSTKNANDRNAFNAQAAGERARDNIVMYQLNESHRTFNITDAYNKDINKKTYANLMDTASIENKGNMNAMIGRYGKKGLKLSHFYTSPRRYGDESYDHYSLTPEGARIIESAKASDAKALQDSSKAWFEEFIKGASETTQVPPVRTVNETGYGLPYNVNTNGFGSPVRIGVDGLTYRDSHGWQGLMDSRLSRQIGYNPITGGNRLLPGRDVMDMANFAYSPFNVFSVRSKLYDDGSALGYKTLQDREFYKPDVDLEYFPVF
jgi:hypothetical protein